MNPVGTSDTLQYGGNPISIRGIAYQTLIPRCAFTPFAFIRRKLERSFSRRQKPHFKVLCRLCEMVCSVGYAHLKCVMCSVPHEFGCQTRLEGKQRAWRPLFLLGAILLLVFAFIPHVTAAAANTQFDAVSSLASGQFAFADFDGDHRPDLATVQTGRDSLATGYWIQLQLSATGRKSFQLVAPPGGVVIEARDVNGDHAVDLVLSTAWFRQPVAIFLNDGHGSFLRAEPSAFPAAFSQSHTNWSPTSDERAEAVGCPPQSQDGSYCEAKELHRGQPSACSVRPPRLALLFGPALSSYSGRAPPLEAPHS